MAKTSPTKRSLDLLRRRGMVVGVVEKWIPQIKRKRDLWNWCDLVAMDAVTGEIIYVQTTSASNASKRVDKIRAWPHLPAFLLRNRAVVHGWSRKGAKGKRKLWACREIEVTELAAPVGEVA